MTSNSCIFFKNYALFKFMHFFKFIHFSNSCTFQIHALFKFMHFSKFSRIKNTYFFFKIPCFSKLPCFLKNSPFKVHFRIPQKNSVFFSKIPRSENYRLYKFRVFSKKFRVYKIPRVYIFLKKPQNKYFCIKKVYLHDKKHIFTR